MHHSFTNMCVQLTQGGWQMCCGKSQKMDASLLFRDDRILFELYPTDSHINRICEEIARVNGRYDIHRRCDGCAYIPVSISEKVTSIHEVTGRCRDSVERARSLSFEDFGARYGNLQHRFKVVPIAKFYEPKEGGPIMFIITDLLVFPDHLISELPFVGMS